MFSLLSFSLLCNHGLARYSGGSGEPNNPYKITTAEDLNDIGNHIEDFNKCFIMTADISLSGYSGSKFNAIGPNTTTPFTGIFDGNGHTISNLYHTSSGAIFPVVMGEQAAIVGVRLFNVRIDVGDVSCGSLVGYLRDGRVENCYTTRPDVSNTSNYCGGLIGQARYAYVGNCHCWNGNVLSEGDAGGLIGFSHFVSVYRCSSFADVSGKYNTGGLIGTCGANGDGGGYISECFSLGTLKGGGWYRVGGLIGVVNGGCIVNCYSNANMETGRHKGGLIGWIVVRGTVINSYYSGYMKYVSVIPGGFVESIQSNGHMGYADVLNCFWDIDVSGTTSSRGGGTGKTTEEMKDAQTFSLWGAGCDAWVIDSGNDYPRLAWEQTQGETIENTVCYEGQGTLAEPYLIQSAEDLNLLGQLPFCWNKSFKLTEDIDLSAYGDDDFCFLGVSTVWPFSGHFDGSGHTISSFVYQVERGYARDSVGIFAHVKGDTAMIENVHLSQASVGNFNRYDVGTLVGILETGEISLCSSSDHVVGTNDEWNIGGLVGNALAGRIFRCFATGTISGSARVGGLVGHNESAQIVECFSFGGITRAGHSGGGLVGYNEGVISQCYSSCDVGYVSHYAGGLAGNNNGTIEYSYAMGHVYGGDHIAGLVPASFGVKYCFWDVNTSGSTMSYGGTGLPTEEMQMQSTYENAGWDFVWETTNGTEDIWAICDSVDYPKLAWQFVLGDIDGDENVDFGDFAQLAGSWQQIVDSFYCGGIDLNGDGRMDLFDIAIFSSYWLEGT